MTNLSIAPEPSSPCGLRPEDLKVARLGYYLLGCICGETGRTRVFSSRTGEYLRSVPCRRCDATRRQIRKLNRAVDVALSLARTVFPRQIRKNRNTGREFFVR